MSIVNEKNNEIYDSFCNDKLIYKEVVDKYK